MLNSVRDVMTHAPWTVPSSRSLSRAARLMRSWDVREVFVVDGDALCGVLSDADIIIVAIASGRSPSELTAGDCCIRDAPRVEVDQAIDDALDVLRRHGLGRAAVVDGDRLVGAVWINDLEQAVARARPSPLPGDRSSARSAPWRFAAVDGRT